MSLACKEKISEKLRTENKTPSEVFLLKANISQNEIDKINSLKKEINIGSNDLSKVVEFINLYTKSLNKDASDIEVLKCIYIIDSFISLFGSNSESFKKFLYNKMFLALKENDNLSLFTKVYLQNQKIIFRYHSGNYVDSTEIIKDTENLINQIFEDIPQSLECIPFYTPLFTSYLFYSYYIGNLNEEVFKNIDNYKAIVEKYKNYEKDMLMFYAHAIYLQMLNYTGADLEKKFQELKEIGSGCNDCVVVYLLMAELVYKVKKGLPLTAQEVTIVKKKIEKTGDTEFIIDYYRLMGNSFSNMLGYRENTSGELVQILNPNIPSQKTNNQFQTISKSEKAYQISLDIARDSSNGLFKIYTIIDLIELKFKNIDLISKNGLQTVSKSSHMKQLRDQISELYWEAFEVLLQHLPEKFEKSPIWKKILDIGIKKVLPNHFVGQPKRCFDYLNNRYIEYKNSQDTVLSAICSTFLNKKMSEEDFKKQAESFLSKYKYSLVDRNDNVVFLRNSISDNRDFWDELMKVNLDNTRQKIKYKTTYSKFGVFFNNLVGKKINVGSKVCILFVERNNHSIQPLTQQELNMLEKILRIYIEIEG